MKLTVLMLKELLKAVPDDVVVKTRKFNGQTYYVNYVIDDEAYFENGVFYIDLGF